MGVHTTPKYGVAALALCFILAWSMPFQPNRVHVISQLCYNFVLRFGFRCCQKSGYYQHFCKLTPILNVWDGVLDYNVPYGYSLVGVHSYHDNRYE